MKNLPNRKERDEMDQISKDIEEYQEECKKKNKRKKMAAEMLKKKVQEAKHR